MNTEVNNERPRSAFKLPSNIIHTASSTSSTYNNDCNAQGSSKSLKRSYSLESMDSDIDLIVFKLNLEEIISYYDTWNHLIVGKQIIIIMMSRCWHCFPWPSFATRFYHPSLPEVFLATSCISTELLYTGSSKSSYLCSSIWSDPQVYITYELVLTSPAVFHMSGSSHLDSFRGRTAAVLKSVASRTCSKYGSQHSCVIAVKLFHYTST